MRLPTLAPPPPPSLPPSLLTPVCFFIPRFTPPFICFFREHRGRRRSRGREGGEREACRGRLRGGRRRHLRDGRGQNNEVGGGGGATLAGIFLLFLPPPCCCRFICSSKRRACFCFLRASLAVEDSSRRGKRTGRQTAVSLFLHDHETATAIAIITVLPCDCCLAVSESPSLIL